MAGFEIASERAHQLWEQAGNPDHVNIVIHNYRWRLSVAEGEPKYDDLEKRLAEGPVITVPTISYRNSILPSGRLVCCDNNNTSATLKKRAAAHRTIARGGTVPFVNGGTPRDPSSFRLRMAPKKRDEAWRETPKITKQMDEA